jgi:glycosyltransferase involved in cell wall biosynthesis
MAKLKLLVLWHEAGNTLYHDRFEELSRLVDLTVVGPDRFQGQRYATPSPDFDFRLFPAWFTGHWLTFISLRLLLFVVRTKFDVLYVHEEPHSIMAFLMAVVRGRRPLVIESSAINKKGNLRGLNILEQYVYSQAGAILPKNPEVGEVLVARGADARKIGFPIGNGVARKSFHVVDKAEARSRLVDKYPQLEPVFSRNDYILGYAGRIWRAKGLDLFGSLNTIDDVGAIVCGPVADESLIKELTDAGVCCLPKLAMADLRLFYSAIDLFILPSRSTPNWREQFGRVCIEAIFCGTPAIGSRVGGIPMVIGEEQTFLPGDWAGAAAMVEALRNADDRAALLATQVAHVEAHFSWAAIAAQVSDVAHATMQGGASHHR